MRLSGEGTIYQRKDGRWVVSIDIATVRYTRYAKSRDEALRKLHELRSAHLAGTLVRPTSLTLSAYLDEWLATASPRLQPSTVESYQQLIRHVQPLGHVRVGSIEPRQLALLYSKLMRKGLSAGRVLKLHRVLHKALGDAVRWELIGKNPAASVDPPARDECQPTLWDLAQMRAFVAATGKDSGTDARLLAFLMLSGVRLGEALALIWADVDLESGVVVIERSLTHVEGRPVEGLPKTRAGVRSLALPQEAVELLRAQHVEQLRRKLAAGLAWQGGDRIWTTSRGTPPLRPNVRRSLHRICDRLGLPRIRVHDLRHLHATLLVAAGADPKSVQRRMGHATLQMTLGVYARALPEADVSAARALSRLMEG